MPTRIMIVDDDAAVRGSIAGILSDEGYLVEAVESAEDALSAVSSVRPDIVLSDVRAARGRPGDAAGRPRTGNRA